MNRHPAAEPMQTGQTNGTLNGRGRSGFGVAKHEHADADEHEREQRSDVGQIVGLPRIPDQRPRATKMPVNSVVTNGTFVFG